MLFIASHALSIPGSLVSGAIGDKVSFWKSIPVFYAGKGLFHMTICLSGSPTNFWTYVSTLGGFTCITCSNVLLNTLMAKSVPSEAKGALLGLMHWFSGVGTLTCAKIGGWLYDKNPQLPFFVFGATAIAYSVFILILRATGTFRQ